MSSKRISDRKMEGSAIKQQQQQQQQQSSSRQDRLVMSSRLEADDFVDSAPTNRYWPADRRCQDRLVISVSCTEDAEPEPPTEDRSDCRGTIGRFLTGRGAQFTSAAADHASSGVVDERTLSQCDSGIASLQGQLMSVPQTSTNEHCDVDVEHLAEHVANLDVQDTDVEQDGGMSIDQQLHVNNFLAAAEPVVSVERLAERLYVRDENGDTTLHMAIIDSVPAHVVDYVIRRAPSSDHLDIQNALFQTALHLAIVTSNPTAVGLLVASGASLRPRDRHGDTALHIACRSPAYGPCLSALLDSFAARGSTQPREVVSWTNYHGKTCFHLAFESRNIDALRQLMLRFPDALNSQGGSCGSTVLHDAVNANDVTVVSMLLDAGLPVSVINQTTWTYRTALDLATSRRLPQLERLLAAAGAVHSDEFCAEVDEASFMSVDEEDADISDD